MINEVRIDNWDELWKLMSEQEYQPDLKRNRSSYVYRGMPHSDYRMVTSLYRNCGEKQQFLEPSILETFTKYAQLEDPDITKSVWNQMIKGQHYGLPTRLLDWTHSPLVALHFAVAGDSYDKVDKNDGMVWRIDIPELHSLLPERYRNVLSESTTKVFSTERLLEITNSPEEYDRDMGDSAMIIIEPPSSDPRIIYQYSFFSIVPTGMKDMEAFLDKYTNNTYKYIISKDLKWRIFDMLDSINISERVLYPGLDGLSQWIARHYYVR